LIPRLRFRGDVLEIPVQEGTAQTGW
jgi:hypothetical protein